MKEKPIIFDAESVRAILAGMKTQGRRVVKPQPSNDPSSSMPWVDEGPTPSGVGRTGRSLRLDECPFGQPGDWLWVRESFSLTGVEQEAGPKVWYRADNNRPTWAERRWRSPIHMPRWASRITLEVVSVRVERVQEIGDDGAYAEGYKARQFYREIDANLEASRTAKLTGRKPETAATAWFRDRWDAINAKRGFGWDTNPWVWVVEFRRVEAE